MTWLARMLGRFVEVAVHEYRAAARERFEREHPAGSVPRLFPDYDCPQMAIANEFALRMTLRKALRQHHPEEAPYEA